VISVTALGRDEELRWFHWRPIPGD
jgi:hypothetical protein